MINQHPLALTNVPSSLTVFPDTFLSLSAPSLLFIPWILEFLSFLSWLHLSSLSTCFFGNFHLPYSVPVYVITPKLCIYLENFIELKIHVSKDTSTWMYDSHQQDNRFKIALSKCLHPQRDFCQLTKSPNSLNSISSHPKYRHHLWLLSPHPSQQILTTDFFSPVISNWSTYPCSHCYHLNLSLLNSLGDPSNALPLPPNPLLF